MKFGICTFILKSTEEIYLKIVDLKPSRTCKRNFALSNQQIELDIQRTIRSINSWFVTHTQPSRLPRHVKSKAHLNISLLAPKSKPTSETIVRRDKEIRASLKTLLRLFHFIWRKAKSDCLLSFIHSVFLISLKPNVQQVAMTNIWREIVIT